MVVVVSETEEVFDAISDAWAFHTITYHSRLIYVLFGGLAH